jgi:hypothetical protein
LFLLLKKYIVMEKERENSGGKRKRKIITHPVLVRSVKPGDAISATYTRTTQANPFWKAA